MKKILSMILTMAMLLCITSQLAFASTYSIGDIFEVPDEFMSGSNLVDYDWTTGDYTVSARYTKGAKYVDQPYIDDSDNNVYIKVKAVTSLTASQNVEGVVTIHDVQERKRYTCKVSFTLSSPDYLYLNEVANKEFTLPGSYGYGVTRFYDVDSKNKYGTLNAEFIDDMSGDILAYYDVKIAEQGNLILSHNSKQIVDIIRKNETANIRFLKWDTTPKFDLTGTLGITMESDEYLYKVGAENKLTAVSGTYNKSRGTFDFKTDTLASYAISDTKLSASAAAASSSSTAASVAPAPAPSSAPVASSVAPPASSVAPPASSVAPSSSSSEPEPSSSEPEPEPSSSEPEPAPSSSSTATVPEKDEDEGSFPILPVAIGLGVVVVGGVAAYFIFNNRSSGKKKYDSWDD